MESIIEFAMDKDKVVVSEHCCSILQNLFSGCRVSFLLGAGFSVGLLGLLNNNEIIFEAARSFQPSTEKEKKQKNILLAYLFWNFFSNCIEPIANTSADDKEFDDYKHFGEILYHIFSTRGNPALDRQFNIFTTNYDPIIELILIIQIVFVTMDLKVESPLCFLQTIMPSLIIVKPFFQTENPKFPL